MNISCETFIFHDTSIFRNGFNSKLFVNKKYQLIAYILKCLQILYFEVALADVLDVLFDALLYE